MLTVLLIGTLFIYAVSEKSYRLNGAVAYAAVAHGAFVFAHGFAVYYAQVVHGTVCTAFSAAYAFIAYL